MSRIERAFIGMSWIPKATVQAALGSVPLDLIHKSMRKEHDDYYQYEKWGNAILVTAVMSVLVTAPIGLLAISTFGPRWLDKLDPYADAVAAEYELALNMNEKGSACLGGDDHPMHVAKKKSISSNDLVDMSNWMYLEGRRRAESTGMNVEIEKEQIERFFFQFQHYANTLNRQLNLNEDMNELPCINVARESLARIIEGIATCRIAIEACKPEQFPSSLLFLKPGIYTDESAPTETLRTHPVEDVNKLDMESGCVPILEAKYPHFSTQWLSRKGKHNRLFNPIEKYPIW